MGNRSTTILGFATLGLLLVACGSDRREYFYQTLADADKAGEITRGWIPDDLIPSSSRAIHLAEQLSPSKEWCAFEFPPAEAEILKRNLKSIDSLPSYLQQVRSPGVSWWPEILRGNLDKEKTKKAGFQLYVVERPANAGDMGIYLFALDWSKGRGFFYWTSVQTGSIEGRISGSTGIFLGASSVEFEETAVPNAKITVKNTSTSAVHTAQSDFMGNFRVEGLSPGRYEVSFVGSPFEKQVHALNVPSGETVDASTRMLVGHDPYDFVEISGCPARPVAGAAPPDLSSAKIELQRGGCYGPCPIYSVQLFGDGRVEYHGDRYVGVLGIRNYRVEPSAIRDLARKFYERGFFNFCASYRQRVTDLGTDSISIHVANITKVVSIYGFRAPEGLEELGEQVERVANLKQLVMPECTKTIRVQGSFPNGPFGTLPNESYRQSPTVKYVIEENGMVSNASLTLSSGLSDMDKKVLNAIGRWKYKPRPTGCGAIETEMTAIIHLE